MNARSCSGLWRGSASAGAALCCTVTATAQPVRNVAVPPDAVPLAIHFDTPAQRWSAEALPIGNGRLGAMCFGGPTRGRIQLNVDSLWTGDDNPSGDYKSMGAYQNLGDLQIELAAGAAGPAVTTVSDHKPFYANEAIDFCHDGKADTKWCVEHSNQPIVWQLQFPAGAEKAINRYFFTSCPGWPTRDPRTWELTASNDGGTWEMLDRRENEEPFAMRGQTKTFRFRNKKAYRTYRLTFEANNGAQHFQIAEIGVPGVNLAGGDTGVASYRRELDIGRAIHAVSYSAEGVTYRREALASHPHEVIAVRLTASRRGAYTGTIRLDGVHREKSVSTGNDVGFSGALDNGLAYEARARVLAEGGRCENTDGTVRFTGCDALTIFVAAGTNYAMDHSRGWRGEHPRDRVGAQLDAAAAVSWSELEASHVEDHRKLFGRVALHLGSTDAKQRDLTTDKRLAAYGQGAVDPELERLLFQFGRYLLIAGSRPNGLPANLQGLWNDSNNPPWHADYHTNINVQMNYWPAEPANLAECHLPLLNLVMAMREPSRAATRAAFGEDVRGWTARTSHNIYGGHGWKWNKPSNAWYALHFREHYAFGGDKEFLRTVAYPMLDEVCQFWEDHLKELPDGTLVVPEGWSPEHGPVEDGVAHDQQIVWDLFSNFVELSTGLDADAERRQHIAGLRDKLAGPKIGKWGQLQEWMVDRDNPEDHHRHTSHLFAVYPGHQISVARTPELAKAARVSLAGRGETGDSRREWAWAWRSCLWARFRDGAKAHDMVRGLLTHNTLPNLLGNHPPMQMDGNFGITAGICEMLLQSHAGEIDLLPALPPAWPSGAVTGLRARGGFEVSIAWANGRPTGAGILSTLGKGIALRAPTRAVRVVTGEGDEWKIDDGGPVVRFETQPGQRYVIEFADSAG